MDFGPWTDLCMSKEMPKGYTHRNRRRRFHLNGFWALDWFMRGWGRRRIAHLHSWKALRLLLKASYGSHQSVRVWETSPSESWGDQQSRKAEEGVSTWMDSEPWTDLCKLHLASWFISEPFWQRWKTMRYEVLLIATAADARIDLEIENSDWLWFVHSQ